MMTDREVWLNAEEIVSIHGNGAARYVLRSLSDVLRSRGGGEDWRRIAAAVDAITEAPQT